MIGLRGLKIRCKLVLVVMSLFGGVSLAILLFFPPQMDALGRGWAERRASAVAEVLASSLAAALDFDDAEGAMEQLAYTRDTPDALYAAVYRADGSTLARWGAAPPPGSGERVRFEGDAIHVRWPIWGEGGGRGELALGFSLETLEREQRSNLMVVLGASAALFGVGVLVSFALGTAMVRPVCRLTETAEAIAAGHIDLDALGGGRGDSRDEISQLGHALGEMAAQLKHMQRMEEDRRAARDEAALALAASAAKSQFLATMSHELRTPLNAVIGLNELLEETELSPLQREYVRAARSSGESLLHVINQVLDLSRVEAGRMELEAIPFSPADLVEELVDAHRASAAGRGLELIAAIGERRWVVGDPTRLRQVLTNLVGNAIKFTHEGRVTLSVSGRSDGDRVALRFEVCDTGVGIPEEKLATLFDPFEQVDSSTTRCYGGSGLGLSIVKRLVERMGGEIAVRSTPGQGSTFALRLSLEETAALPRERPARAELPDAGRPWRVLVAEDHPVNQMLIERLLLREGCEVTLAEDGLRALEALRRGAYDLVLMDCMMPNMDGYQATRAVRAGEAGDPDIPILALTASALKEDERRCLEVGMSGYLTKPLRRDVLVRAICRALATEEAAA